jgi:ABC-type transport system involved in multi-copper enzyme maturation permease subunit
MSLLLSLARTTLLEAVRNRIGWIAVATIGIAVCIALFLNQVAITETREIQSALLAALLRVAAVFILSTFVITSMVRAANDKLIELLLSLPATRASIWLGKLCGYMLVAAILAIAFALPLWASAPAMGIVAWCASLFCELLIVTTVSLFCVLSLTQVPAAFAAVAAFYLLSRSMTAMQLIAGAQTSDPSFADRVIAHIVNAIALVLPALDRMTDTAWLIESPPAGSELAAILMQAVLYVVLIGAAALFDLYRKNF